MKILYLELTVKVLPVRPIIFPSLAFTTVLVSTSPLPVVSMISMIFGFPSVVTYTENKYEIITTWNFKDIQTGFKNQFIKQKNFEII